MSTQSKGRMKLFSAKSSPYSATRSNIRNRPKTAPEKSSKSKYRSRPAWNSFQKDDGEFRLPKEEMLRRRQLFVSKHNILAKNVPQQRSRTVSSTNTSKQHRSASIKKTSIQKKTLKSEAKPSAAASRKLRMDEDGADSKLNWSTIQTSVEDHDLDSLTLIDLEEAGAEFPKSCDSKPMPPNQSQETGPVQTPASKHTANGSSRSRPLQPRPNSPTTAGEGNTKAAIVGGNATASLSAKGAGGLERSGPLPKRSGGCLEALGRVAAALGSATEDKGLKLEDLREALQEAQESAETLDGSVLLPACALSPIVSVLHSLIDRSVTSEERYSKALRREMALVSEVKDLKQNVESLERMFCQQQELMAKITQSLEQRKENIPVQSRQQVQEVQGTPGATDEKSNRAQEELISPTLVPKDTPGTGFSEVETTNESISFNVGDSEDSSFLEGAESSMEAWAQALDRVGALLARGPSDLPQEHSPQKPVQTSSRTRGQTLPSISEDENALNPWEQDQASPPSRSQGLSSASISRGIEAHAQLVQRHLDQVSLETERLNTPPKHATPPEVHQVLEDLYTSSPSTDNISLYKVLRPQPSAKDYDQQGNHQPGTGHQPGLATGNQEELFNHSFKSATLSPLAGSGLVQAQTPSLTDDSVQQAFRNPLAAVLSPKEHRVYSQNYMLPSETYHHNKDNVLASVDENIPPVPYPFVQPTHPFQGKVSGINFESDHSQPKNQTSTQNQPQRRTTSGVGEWHTPRSALQNI